MVTNSALNCIFFGVQMLYKDLMGSEVFCLSEMWVVHEWIGRVIARVSALYLVLFIDVRAIGRIIFDD